MESEITNGATGAEKRKSMSQSQLKQKREDLESKLSSKHDEVVNAVRAEKQDIELIHRLLHEEQDIESEIWALEKELYP